MVSLYVPATRPSDCGGIVAWTLISERQAPRFRVPVLAVVATWNDWKAPGMPPAPCSTASWKPTVRLYGMLEVNWLLSKSPGVPFTRPFGPFVFVTVTVLSVLQPAPVDWLSTLIVST